MFICYVHGWRSHEAPCPLCHPAKVFTTPNVIFIEQDGDHNEPVIPYTPVDSVDEKGDADGK